ncbi:hypothetical protein GCM10027347_41920 [Larkinella harenae]
MNAFHFFSEPVTNALGWGLMHTTWQGTLLALTTALLLRLTQQKASSVRYSISIGALALQLVLFVITCWIAYEPVRPTMLIRGEPLEEPASAVLVLNLPVVDNWSGHIINGLQPHLSVVVALWLLGSAVLFVRLLGGWLFIQRLQKRGIQAAPVAWQQHLNRLAEQLGISNAIRLFESTEITVPMTVGWLKPIVLIPVGLLAGLSPREVEAVLIHELAHIRRYDYLVNLVQSAVEVVLFFHPAIWWLSARVREEREHCCDDVAIQLCGERASLAQALVHIEQRRQAQVPTPELAMAFGARKPSFMQRVKRVIGVPVSNPKPNGWGVAGLLVLLAGLVTGQNHYRPAMINRAVSNPRTASNALPRAATQQLDSQTREEPQSMSVSTAIPGDTIEPEKPAEESGLEYQIRALEELKEELAKLHESLVGEQVEQEGTNRTDESQKSRQKLQKEFARVERELAKQFRNQSHLQGKLKEAEADLYNRFRQPMGPSSRRHWEQMRYEDQQKVLEESQEALQQVWQSMAKPMDDFLKEHENFAQPDSLPKPKPAVAPKSSFSAEPTQEPSPAVAPSVATPPARVGKAAAKKGEYWYNGKRYNSPDEIPAPPTPPVPPPAVESVEPFPPAEVPTEPAPSRFEAVPAAPAPPKVPKAPKAAKKGWHIKTND